MLLVNTYIQQMFKVQQHFKPYSIIQIIHYWISFDIHIKAVSKPGVSKLQPAGQMRLAKPFHPTRKAIMSNDEKNYQNFVDLVECNIS